jgi:hypothetical protein
LTIKDTTTYMTAPSEAHNGTPALPKRAGTRGLLPTTWIKRELRIEHVVGGAVRESRGTFLDWTPVGPILLVRGHRTLISWDTLATVELVPD